jgi:hypothetical protein
VRRACNFRPYRAQPPQRSVWLLTNHGDLYNAALEERLEAWRTRKPGIRSGSHSAQFGKTRACDRGGQGRHLFTAQWPTPRWVDVVFEVFCDRSEAGPQPGYPRFEPHSRFGHVMFCHRRPVRGRAGRAVVRSGRELARQAAS